MAQELFAAVPTRQARMKLAAPSVQPFGAPLCATIVAFPCKRS